MVTVRWCPQCATPYGTKLAKCIGDGKTLGDKDPLPGRHLSAWEVTRFVAAGSNGVVYEGVGVTDRTRRVAIKVLYGELAKSGRGSARFQKAADVAQILEHPNIVRVLEAGRALTGVQFSAMEYFEGPLLSDAIAAEAPFPFERAALIARGIAVGLAHAHANNFVHRDVQPENVILVKTPEGDLPKLFDFDLVGNLSEPDAERLSQSGELIGTPRYMAPEQSLSSRVGPPADLYALGLVLHEMVSKRFPFSGSDLEILRSKTLSDVPKLETTTGLEPLIAKLLDRDPLRRPTAAAAVKELDALLKARGITPPATKAEPLPGEKRGLRGLFSKLVGD